MSGRAIRPHNAHHTHAGLGVVSAGVPLVTMSPRLADSGVGITADIYTHGAPGARQTASENVAAVILRRHRTDPSRHRLPRTRRRGAEGSRPGAVVHPALHNATLSALALLRGQAKPAL